VQAATPTLQGPNDTTLEDAGPLFPAACTTKTPAFRANNRNIKHAQEGHVVFWWFIWSNRE